MSNSTAAISSPSSSILSDTSSSILSDTSITAPPTVASITPTLAPTTPPDTPSVIIVSSVVTESAPSTINGQLTTVILTSTAPFPSTIPPVITSTSSSTTSSSSSSSAAFASHTSTPKKGSGGLSGGGKVAVAVVVPIVAVAVLVLAGLWFWRRRKQRKNSEELRKKEIEEYGFNPNNDPTLPAVGSGDGTSEMREDGAGYRGWGATSSNTRQPSTNLSSGRGGVGLAVSDEGSNGYGPNSPTHPHSEGYSNDPLVGNQQGGRPLTGDSETIGALPAVPVAAGGRQDNIHRGPSNASSAYSAGNHSDHSGDAPIPVGNPGGPQYYADEPYYNESAQPQHGPYGDGTYGGEQPVIRDTNARRNTRIEKPAVYPPQGNSGIAQNF